MSKDYKCVLLKEMPEMGNHILLPFGSTLCGCFTNDADKKHFKGLTDDIVSTYEEIQEWDITCERCIEILELIKKVRKPKIDINYF